jgi:UDP-N-acetylmuramoyl-tripeptide--D-alanyl-D-alanine ligase
VNENDPIQVEKTDGYDLVIPFGRRDSEFYFEKFTENNCVGIIYNEVEALSKLTGDYNFTNLCAATSLGLYFGIDFNLIKKAIEEYTPTNMRSQIVKKGDKTLVLDTYNANPSSMKVSLENFNDFIGTKTIIIGDMLELGEESAAEHSQILELAKSLNFDEIITVGPHFKEVNASGVAYLTTQDLINYLTGNEIHSQNILLKASRGIALEKALEFIK